MTRITVLGGTGYTGSNIVREAAARGAEVTCYSRSLPAQPISSVQYETGSLLDDDVRSQAVSGADVVVAALSPRGDLENELAGLYARIAELAAAAGVRLGVVGGFSSLRLAEGGPRIAEGDGIPPQFVGEARAMASIVDELLASAPAELDWFFVCPAASYGAYAPGVTTGKYRIGGDVALLDEAGNSAISGTDFASAIVDEIETPVHHRSQFSVVS